MRKNQRDRNRFNLVGRPLRRNKETFRKYLFFLLRAQVCQDLANHTEPETVVRNGPFFFLLVEKLWNAPTIGPPIGRAVARRRGR